MTIRNPFGTGTIRAMTDPFIAENILEFLAAEQGADDVDAMPDCYIGVIDNYVSDGPGYVGPVYVLVWSGSPGCITTLTCDEQGEFKIAANVGA